jgi:hypothetical protein
MKRFSLILFALLVCVTPLPFSCAAQTPAESAGTDLLSADSDTAETKILPELPEADYEGAGFLILDIDAPTAWWLENFEFYTAEQSGEVLNDAVYTRNFNIEERYNIKIGEYRDLTPREVIKKSINADDDTYDICVEKMSELAKLATDGYFYNFIGIPHVDLEKPWWDNNAVEYFSLAHNLYFMTGDYMLLDKYRVYCILFNKDIAQDYNIGNLYNTVDEGIWTIDLMHSMARSAVKDLNGNSITDYEDQYGLLSQAYDNFYGMVYGAGNRISVKDGDDMPVIGMYTDRLVTTTDKLIEFICDTDIALFMQDIKGTDRPDIYMATMFEQDQALFYNALLVCAKMTYQNTQDLDFGIIPQPKFDEKQENYLTTTQYTYAPGCAVPRNNRDIEMTGLLLEALSAESMYITMPAFYEITIKTKYTPDEKAPIMLDMIFNNIIYDVASVFDWGGLRTIIDNILPQKKENQLASLYEKAAERAETQMQKTMATYLGN